MSGLLGEEPMVEVRDCYCGARASVDCDSASIHTYNTPVHFVRCNRRYCEFSGPRGWDYNEAAERWNEIQLILRQAGIKAPKFENRSQNG